MRGGKEEHDANYNKARKSSVDQCAPIHIASLIANDSAKRRGLYPRPSEWNERLKRFVIRHLSDRRDSALGAAENFWLKICTGRKRTLNLDSAYWYHSWCNATCSELSLSLALPFHLWNAGVTHHGLTRLFQKENPRQNPRNEFSLISKQDFPYT